MGEDMSIYPVITVPSGVILYSGGRWNADDACPDQYRYLGVGSRVSRGHKVYLSNSEMAAEGYAMGINTGWVKKYATNQEIRLLDITARQEQVEPYEMDDLICNRPDIKGYYMVWPTGVIEIATCEAREIMTYLGAKQRLQGGIFSEWICLPAAAAAEAHGRIRKKKYKKLTVKMVKKAKSKKRTYRTKKAKSKKRTRRSRK